MEIPYIFSSKDCAPLKNKSQIPSVRILVRYHASGTLGARNQDRFPGKIPIFYIWKNKNHMEPNKTPPGVITTIFLIIGGLTLFAMVWTGFAASIRFISSLPWYIYILALVGIFVLWQKLID